MLSKRQKGWLAFSVCLLALMVVASCGCGSIASGLPDDAYQAEADAAVVATLSADPVLVNPDDGAKPQPRPEPKPGDVCPNCDGRGTSGDGLSPCRKCGGDGRIDERDLATGIGDAPPAAAAVQPETSKRSIVMHATEKDVADADGWPLAWWRETRPRLVSDGWEVTAGREEDPEKETWFEVCEGDRCRVMIGKQPYEAF